MFVRAIVSFMTLPLLVFEANAFLFGDGCRLSARASVSFGLGLLMSFELKVTTNGGNQKIVGPLSVPSRETLVVRHVLFQARMALHLRPKQGFQVLFLRQLSHASERELPFVEKKLSNHHRAF